MTSALFWSLCLLISSVSVFSQPCVSPSTCLNVTLLAENTTCPGVGLVPCELLSDCVRTTEFWSTHPAEWPLENGSFCYHTWGDIVIQDPLDGLAFPQACHSLATILITLRLNEVIKKDLGSRTLFSSMDMAELEVVSCCTTPTKADIITMHQLFTLLMAEYNAMNKSFCIDTSATVESSFFLRTLPLFDIITLGFLGLSALLVVSVSIPAAIHYSILCRVWNNPEGSAEYNNRAFYMVLREKYRCYTISDDMSDEEGGEEKN